MLRDYTKVAFKIPNPNCPSGAFHAGGENGAYSGGIPFRRTAMPHPRADLKAELEAEAARLIEEALAWNDQADAPTLTEIEEQVLKFRKALGERLAQALVE